MAVPLITITMGGLTGLAELFDSIGTAVGPSAQKALNEVATNSLKRLAVVVDTDVDHGPVRFTKVNPTGRTSSMSMRRGRYVAGADDAESDVHVNPLQSRYLKYLLGVDDLRHAGDVGAAKDHNFIPMEDAFGNLDMQGADPVYGQNLRPHTLQKLFNRMKKQKAAVAAARAKGRAPRPTGALKYGRLFYGRPGGTGTLGIYERTPSRPMPIKLLILAIKQSEYRKPTGYLLPGWNRSVQGAMATYPMRVERRLIEEVRARGLGTTVVGGRIV